MRCVEADRGLARVAKVTVDAASIAAQQAAGGGHRRVLAEEASCTPDYVHEHTAAIDAECARPGLERRLPSMSTNKFGSSP